ncbi:MAG: heparinase II/III family protein [Candidatus Omnitrophota bacterium]
MSKFEGYKNGLFYWIPLLLAGLFLLLSIRVGLSENPPPRKQANALYTPQLMQFAIGNAKNHEWAKAIQTRIVERAKPWRECSDDELWQAMFGPAITRTWMVWSDGICPQCKKDVKMYNWIIDIWNQPFKVRCPHCQALFPKNDFGKFYRSGLDGRGVFDPQKADRSLLFNEEHPNPNDALYSFGVDDGEGYVDGEKRWRFIGYYLVAGQWRQKVMGGLRSLSQAYVSTGNLVYAHKAGILLDRVADLYPDFDFKSQGLVYERGGHQGYVTVWHDACEEARELAQAYDRVFEAMREDKELVSCLAQKADQYKMENKKSSFAEIQANIEDNILRHTLAHRERIESNFPRTPAALATIETVLEWPNNRDRVIELLSGILSDSLKEDGLTGEKGLSGYTTIFPRSFAEIITLFDRLDPNLLPDLYKKFPDLYKTYRFYVDTWCLEKFYPRIGDCGWFGSESPIYCGVSFAKPAQDPEPSMFGFLWRMYELTRDPAFVQVLYKANGLSTEGLPHDLCADNPQKFQERAQKVINDVGTVVSPGDVRFEEWGLSILRSGKNELRRAAWLDHDAGGRHSHQDGLNLGLFAKGMDLLPDFGYPPVGYGGWSAPKAVWYTRTAAHDAVVVDGKNQSPGKGKTTLWGAGKKFDVVRVSAPEIIKGEVYERTIAKVDISERDFYLLDLFDVKGGQEHAFFLSSNFAKVETQGLKLETPIDYGHETQTRNFLADLKPSRGWSVDWNLEDRSGAEPVKTNVHLRYTSLTPNAEAALGECWIDFSNTFGGKEEWIPRLMIRRQSVSETLSSHFIGVLEPYENESNIKEISNPSENAVIVALADGRRQGFLFSHEAKSKSITAGDFNLESDADFCFSSQRENRIEHIAISNGQYARGGKTAIKLKRQNPFVEIEFQNGKAMILSGNAGEVESVVVEGKAIPIATP